MMIFFSAFPGPDCLPAGWEKRPGELEERPCAEDQDAGVRAQAGEVNARPVHSLRTAIHQLARWNHSVVVDAAIKNDTKRRHFSAARTLGALHSECTVLRPSSCSLRPTLGKTSPLHECCVCRCRRSIIPLWKTCRTGWLSSCSTEITGWSVGSGAPGVSSRNVFQGCPRDCAVRRFCWFQPMGYLLQLLTNIDICWDVQEKKSCGLQHFLRNKHILHYTVNVYKLPTV